VGMGGSGLDLHSSETGQVAGFLEHRKESFGSIKFGEFFSLSINIWEKTILHEFNYPRMRKDRFVSFVLEFKP